MEERGQDFWPVTTVLSSGEERALDLVRVWCTVFFPWGVTGEAGLELHGPTNSSSK